MPLWTVVHGTSSLLIDDNLAVIAPETDVDVLVEETTKSFLAGVLARQ